MNYSRWNTKKPQHAHQDDGRRRRLGLQYTHSSYMPYFAGAIRSFGWLEMTDTSPSMSRQWFRRYKSFFVIGLLLLCIQLVLAYLLPIFSTSGDIYDVSFGSLYDHVLDDRRARQNKAVFNELFAAERPSMDDEYISNSNSLYNNFKDPVVHSKTSSSTKDHSEGTNSLNSKNRHGGGGGGGASSGFDVHLQLDDLKLKPMWYCNKRSDIGHLSCRNATVQRDNRQYFVCHTNEAILSNTFTKSLSTRCVRTESIARLLSRR